MPVYIVSGFMRSGTSMMMRALVAGGLEAVYNPARDRLNDLHADGYKINEDGFYELSRAEYLHPDFPDRHAGKLVKILWGGMPYLRASDNLKHIAFMRRPVAEIAASYEAAFDSYHPATIPELDQKLDRIQGILAKRADVRLSVVQYHDVLSDPLRAFTELNQSGFPIDPAGAAAVVRPDRRRHRA